MSLNVLRGLMNCFAIEAAVVGAVGLFWSLAWAWAIAVAMVLFLVGDCIHWCSDHRRSQPPFTTQYGYAAHHPEARR